MFLKKVLNQPNLVGTMLIALMVCSGFVYAFAFDGFNVETATGGEVEAWLAQEAGADAYNETCDNCGYSSSCPGAGCECTGSGITPCNDKCKGNGKCKPTCSSNTNKKMCPGLSTCNGKNTGCSNM